MATDVTSLWHTIDDDITFERVRHMPRRTQFVSNHRKLSWQFDKELKQVERDMRLSTVEIGRAQSLMTEKLTRLQDTKKQLVIKKMGGDSRCNSEPCLSFTDLRLQNEQPELHAHAPTASLFGHDNSNASKVGNAKAGTLTVKSQYFGQNDTRKAGFLEGETKGLKLAASLKQSLCKMVSTDRARFPNRPQKRSNKK